MKIIFVNGSSHANGTTMQAVKEMQKIENPFAFKPGASIAVARRGGTTASFDVLNKYFGISQMPVAGSTYWNITHGLTAEDAVKDREGMQTLRNLARNMVWMMRSFALAKEQGIPYPETESGARTNFIQRED